jgi:hypothetical protein
MTLTGTRKVIDIESNTHAAFVVSSEEAPQTLQIEGTLSDLTETAVIDSVTRALIAKTQERGSSFAPLTHFDSGQVRFYKLTPTWVRWGDFTDGFGSDKSLFEIEL